MTNQLTSFAGLLRERISLWDEGFEPAQRDRRFFDDDEFNRLALELFALQFTYNAAYRRLCEARSATPATVEHWSRIPAVPAAAFKELELSCLAPSERTVVFYSSRTTGQQHSRHFHSDQSLKLYEASLWPWFRKHVLGELGKDGWQLLVLTPWSVSAPNSSLVHMFETIRNRSGLGDGSFVGGVGADAAWTVHVAQAEAAFRHSVETGARLVLLGTAFNFVHLLEALMAKGLKFNLPAGSRVMETGGYKGRSRELSKAELHAVIEQRLSVPRSHIISEYGMSELSSQAYDGSAAPAQPATRNFHFPPWCRVQIISPETAREAQEGETGLIRIFDLANAFSVIAVQTEDLGIRHGGGFGLLGRAMAAESRGCSLMAVESI